MSPPNARIFLVEDEPMSIESAHLLERFGHSIVLQASSFDQAMSAIPTLRANQINVAVVDRDLIQLYDGEMVASEIRRQCGTEVKIVGNAHRSEMIEVDINSPKIEGRIHLARVIEEL